MFIEKNWVISVTGINIDSDIISELTYLYTSMILTRNYRVCLDKNERAHMDYNRENGTITFIYNVLVLKRTRNTMKPFL